MGNSKKERSEIYAKIVSSLRESPNNANKIALQTKINWETVKTALESLYASGFLEKNNKTYSIKQQLPLNNNTILGLPLSEDQNKLFCQLANRIKELQPDIKQTFLQKAVVQTIKRAHITFLPYAWYLYGECCVHKLTHLDYDESTKQYDEFIIPILDDFKEFSTTNSLLEYIYTQEQNELYLLKLSIEDKLKKEFSEETIRELNRLFMQVTLYLHRNNIDEKTIQYFEYFTSSFSMLKRLPLEQFEALRIELISTFSLVWQYIATTNYEAIEKFYSSQPLEVYFNLRKESLEESLQLQLTKLKDEWPLLILSPKLQKIRDKVVKDFEGE